MKRKKRRKKLYDKDIRDAKTKKKKKLAEIFILLAKNLNE